MGGELLSKLQNFIQKRARSARKTALVSSNARLIAEKKYLVKVCRNILKIPLNSVFSETNISLHT